MYKKIKGTDIKVAGARYKEGTLIRTISYNTATMHNHSGTLLMKIPHK
jgi:hypothetical protein